MYDWANSAYVTTVAVGLLPRYFADVVVPPQGIRIGGGLQFALALCLVNWHDAFGLSLEQAVRLGIVTAGLWWAAFTIFTARLLTEPPASGAPPQEFRRWPRLLAYVIVGVTRTWRTT